MKTIFVSISNPVVFRNFALFPDSVVEQIAGGENYRIVLLIKKNLANGFVEKNKDKFIIEEFDENLKKNFIQKLFYFFYSYLIFTDTTMLVSSYGVRADKPRPLYKYWNFPFKIFLANTFGKSRWIKEVLAPKMYLWIFSNRPYGYLFDKYRPELVFLTNICIWPADLEFLAEAGRRGIKSIGMPANWDHMSKYYIPFKPDKLLVWSRQVKYEAVKFQNYNDEQIKIIGAPQIDFLINKNNLLSREEFNKKTGFPDGCKIITFFSQGPYSLDGADLVDMILEWIKEGKLPQNLRIIIRPHPSGYKEIDKYLPFKDDHLVYIDDVEGWSSVENTKNYINVLFHSDVVLTTYSSIATEASIFDRPTVIAGFDGYKSRPIYQSVRRHKKFTHFQYLLAFGAIRVTETSDQMFGAISEYLKRPELDHAARLKLREEVFGFIDGKNSERIVREITAML